MEDGTRTGHQTQKHATGNDLIDIKPGLKEQFIYLNHEYSMYILKHVSTEVMLKGVLCVRDFGLQLYYLVRIYLVHTMHKLF